MNYQFPALISRPVTFDGDPDCQDAYSVPVIVRCDVCGDGAVWFRDAEVSTDVRGDDGSIVYHRGEIIGENSFTADNVAEMKAAYLNNRQWDAEDKVRDFPDYGSDPAPAEDYDQRLRLRAA